MASQLIPTQNESATQGGSGTGHTNSLISGVNVAFPCKPYPSQYAMMSKVIQGLKTQKNCLLESPTGSGKSLALLCAALGWQRHESARVIQYNAEIDAREEEMFARMREKTDKKTKKGKGDSDEQSSRRRKTPVKQGANKDNVNAFAESTTIAEEESTEVSIVGTSDDDDDDFKPTKRSKLSLLMHKSLDCSVEPEPLEENSTVNNRSKLNLEDEAPYFVPAEKKLAVPKIFYGTRTHKQIAQILRELRKTEYRNVRSVILSSREHTCINPLVEKLPNKNEACRDLLQNASGHGPGCFWHSGARKLGTFHAINSVGVPTAYDLEDLVSAGRKFKSCPYYVTRFLTPSADIIFCPYNYLIDPSIRKTMGLEITDHVIILDEGHNIEDASREASSFTIKQDELQRALQDCEKVARGGTQPRAHTEISGFLSHLSQWIDEQEHHLKVNSFNSAGKCWNGTEFLGSAQAGALTEDKIKEYIGEYAEILSHRDMQMEAVKERGGKRMGQEKPVISAQTTTVVESALRLFQELTRQNGSYRDDFRVAISKDTIKQRRDGNSGPFRSVQVMQLHLWCLNSAVAFQELKESAKAIILTSGTLSPMQSFESELGTPFSLKLEASHVIDKNQIFAGVLGVGPSGTNMNGSYQNTEKLAYQDDLGNAVLRVCQTMPYGVLCFFPSYRMLNTIIDRWRVTGLLDKLTKIKTVVVEPRGGGPDIFTQAMETYYNAVNDYVENPGLSTQTGAIFFAVCRGKVSEGLDFADHNARAVICIGIPFPNFKDMQVELKRDYNTRNTHRGLLNGSEWYEIQAFRAINQALGRCIRHRHDWGAIILIDDRYIKNSRYIQSLSRWIRSSIVNYTNFSSLSQNLIKFKDERLASIPVTPIFSSQMVKEANCSMPDTGFSDAPLSNIVNLKPTYDLANNDTEVASLPVSLNNTRGPYSSGGGLMIDRNRTSSPANRSSEISEYFPSENRSSEKKVFTRHPTFNKSVYSLQNPKSNLASMFAKQVQKAEAEESIYAKFIPGETSIGTPPPDVPDTDSERNNRPRKTEKKMKL